MQIKKTKAAILTELNKPLVIDEVELPDKLACGQVLVKVNYSGICGSQLGEIAGVKGEDKYLPHLLGHEGSGVVIETGDGVKHVKQGDHVVLHWMKGRGIESEPPVYQGRGKRLNAGWVTTFNEYAVVSENRVTPVPADLDGEIASLFGCAVTTGLGVITNNAKLKMGESVVVYGAGGVGLNIIQGARLVSAYPIIGVDIYDDKLKLAQKIGATHTVNAAKSGPKEEIAKIAGSGGVDVVIDNTGVPDIIQLAYEITKPKGRVILVGVPKKGNNISIYSLPLHFGKVLTGSHGGETDPAEDIPRYLKLVESGILNLDSLITHRFTFEEINKAIVMMHTGGIGGRCIIKMHTPV